MLPGISCEDPHWPVCPASHQSVICQIQQFIEAQEPFEICNAAKRGQADIIGRAARSHSPVHQMELDYPFGIR